MAVYPIIFKNLEGNYTPVIHRKPRFLKFLEALLHPLQWLNNNFSIEYINGSVAAFFVDTTTYAVDDKVIDIDNGVYELYDASKVISLGGGHFQNPYLNLDAWRLICSDYRGSYERIAYNSQFLTLEFILNKFFRTTFTQPPQTPLPDIYLQSNNVNNNVFIAGDSDAVWSNVYALDQFVAACVFDGYTFSQYAFTIWVPIAVYTALQPNALEKSRAVADRYVIAGILYDIQTY